MEQITQERKEELEKTLGFQICPLTAEETDFPLHIGLYLNAGPVTKYECAVDGKAARGGTPSTIMPFTAIRPCPEEYARNCNLYKNNGMKITHLFETDNRKRLNEPTMENFID